jgi:hypothetical protein
MRLGRDAFWPGFSQSEGKGSCGTLQDEIGKFQLCLIVGDIDEEHSSWAKARVDSAAFAARLKSCPDTKQAR